VGVGDAVRQGDLKRVFVHGDQWGMREDDKTSASRHMCASYVRCIQMISSMVLTDVTDFLDLWGRPREVRGTRYGQTADLL